MYVIQYDFKQNADFLCMYILQIKKKKKKIHSNCQNYLFKLTKIGAKVLMLLW